MKVFCKMFGHTYTVNRGSKMAAAFGDKALIGHSKNVFNANSYDIYGKVTVSEKRNTVTQNSECKRCGFKG